MNRKSVIKHIISEAKGNPILAEQYAFQETLSPIIKEMRGMIETAKGRLKTIKSLAMKVESGKLGRDSLEDVKKIWLECNHLFTKLFEHRNTIAKHIQDAYKDEVMPMDLAKEVISVSYRHISNAQALSRRAFKHCCFESADSTIEDAELCEMDLGKLSESLYKITKGMLY